MPKCTTVIQDQTSSRRRSSVISFPKAVALWMFLAVCASSVKASTAYTFIPSFSTDQFGTIDLTTGVFSSLGAPTSPELAGLGVFNGALYGVELHNRGGYGDSCSACTLYKVNIADGSLMGVGPANIGYSDFGSTTTGLFAVDGGTIANGFKASLYSINPSNGAATLIGNTGHSFGIPSMSTNSGTLYITDNSPNPTLYTLDTNTGLATMVGGLGSLGGPGSYIAAMVFEDNVLWGTDNEGTGKVYKINTTTGDAGTGQSITGNSSNNPALGLAPNPIPSVPEPSSYLLVSVGIAYLVFKSKRPHRRIQQ